MKPRAYGPFEYSPIVDRPPLRWPNGARIALYIIPNVEFFALDEAIPVANGGSGRVPDVPVWSLRDYGNRVGIFRLMEVLDRYELRATVALNANLCAQHPAIIEKGVARGWEFMGHGQTNSRRLNDVPPEEEPSIIERTKSMIEAATGKRPVGWLGSALQETWQTVDLLAAAGYEYVCDWTNDDQPYTMTLDGGGHLISVPYAHECNDKHAYDRFHSTPEEFTATICRQFDVLYREGAESARVMPIVLHPYLSGVPHRVGAVDAALEYICQHDGVWRATGCEIARHFAATAAVQHA